MTRISGSDELLKSAAWNPRVLIDARMLLQKSEPIRKESATDLLQEWVEAWDDVDSGEQGIYERAKAFLERKSE